MKKYFFLSIVAVGAMFASCSKSEIVDSKFGNDEIGFQAYLGRDAQTKAAVTNSDNIPSIGLFGYYLGNGSWSTSSVANLWANTTVTAASNWTPSPTRFWANASDKYAFLAYAPVAPIENVLTVTATDPTLTYNVPSTLSEQKDIVVSNNKKDIVRPDGGTVALQFEHALARLTVKATAESGPFTFHVKEVSISGAFNTSGTFNLYEGIWKTKNPVAGTKYTFYTDTDVINSDDAAEADKLTSVDYSGTVVDAEGNVTTAGNNYLMMIPTEFSSTNKAELYVKYTTYYMGSESKPIEKTFDVTTNFVNGKAYAINLEFKQETGNDIKFSVAVTPWDENTTGQTGTIE